MARTLKNTRIKGLPARVQLQQKDAASGSFPVKTRIASDNRTGFFSSSFDDMKTVPFTSYLSGSENQGFNVVAADGTYSNYSLGPAYPGGSVYSWWRFQSKSSSGGVYSTPNSAMSMYSGSFDTSNYTLSTTKLPSYYNNGGTLWPNTNSVYVDGTGTGIFTTYSSSDGRNSEILRDQVLNFTLATHFYVGSLLPYYPFFWVGTNNSTPIFEVLGASTGEIVIGFFSSPTKYQIFSSSLAAFNEKHWHHLAVAVSGNSNSDVGATVYVDGAAIDMIPVVNTGFSGAPTDSGTVHLGAAFDTLGYVGNDVVGDGYYSQFVFANRPITADEAVYLYNGTVPSASVGVMMPVGLHTSHPALKRYDAYGSFVDDPEMTTDLVVSGIVRKGVGDSFVRYTPGQDIQPFRDCNNPAVDGKSQGNVFYATGSKVSDIGEGFDQPLWSKTKIEIDLTPNSVHSVYIENYTSGSNNYPMCYWNKDLKKWQGIGTGKEFGTYANTLSGLQKLWDEQCIGFAQGLDNGGASVRDLAAGAPTSNFGFPYHGKFHATSSNTISLSDYIQEPFLVEKIVLEFSGTFAQNSFVGAGSTKATMNTFFILNQRAPFRYIDGGFQTIPYRVINISTASFEVTGATIPETINGNYCATSRDLVTWAQFVAFQTGDATSIERMSRELNLTGTNGNWSGRYALSGTVKSPLSSDGHAEMSLGDSVQFMLLNKNGSRNGLFVPSGRDHIGPSDRGNVVSSARLNFFNAPVVSLARYSKPNPYLLLPTDNLVLGWQLPLFNALNDNGDSPTYNTRGPSLTFAAAPAKLVIYGSMVREGKEHHDTLNQHLTSVSVHEVIG